MDFTLIPNMIAETMESMNEPLSEKQKIILQGALAAYQDEIAKKGLPRLLSSLEKRNS